MSIANIIEYAARCESDPELRAEIAALGADDPHARMAHAAAMGLPFGPVEAAALRFQIAHPAPLAEADLDRVSAGSGASDGGVRGLLALTETLLAPYRAPAPRAAAF